MSEVKGALRDSWWRAEIDERFCPEAFHATWWRGLPTGGPRARALAEISNEAGDSAAFCDLADPGARAAARLGKQQGQEG